MVDDAVVSELASRFGLRSDLLSLIQGDRNLVYEGSSALGEAVLKVVPSAESSHNLLLGELDWIVHLHANGVSVPRPLRSRSGRLLESLDLDERGFSAYCYRRIEGPLWQHVHNPDDYVSTVGQLAGRMHAVSSGYAPTIQGAARPSWRQAPWFASPADTIHPSMLGVIEKCLELREAIDKLPCDDWGLVHDDLHGGNVVISPGGPVAIDFECSHYSRLASEIGSALFFWLWKTPDSQPQELAHRAATFLRAFLDGYNQEHSLRTGWIEALPLFLKARELSIFASSGLESLDFEAHGKHDRTFSWMKGNIEDGVPYVEVDFESFSAP